MTKEVIWEDSPYREKKHILSALTRLAYEEKQPMPAFKSQHDIDAALANSPQYTNMEKLDLILLHVRKMAPKVGEYTQLIPVWDYLIAFAENPKEFADMVTTLRDEMHLLKNTDNGMFSLTVDGMKHLDSLGNKIKQSRRVFVIHGRSEKHQDAVTEFLKSNGIEPIILHEQATGGSKAVLEKLERYAATVGYAVVLLTPDDIGGLKAKEPSLKDRARQNVILELGYFLAILGRNKVTALYCQGVELPTDYDGIVYISFEDPEGWKVKLKRELIEASILSKLAS